MMPPQSRRERRSTGPSIPASADGGFFPKHVAELSADQTDAASLHEAMELAVLADKTAEQAQDYLDTLTDIATGQNPEAAFPVLMLAVTQIAAAGAKLGATTDIVPSEQFESDTGMDMDLDPLRIGLSNLLHGIDIYAEVLDPLMGAEVVTSQLSDDLTDIAADLAHGLNHYEQGRIDEALWWWQYSYLATWGARAGSAMRMVMAVIQHTRLDVDADTAGEAQFDALHIVR